MNLTVTKYIKSPAGLKIIQGFSVMTVAYPTPVFSPLKGSVSVGSSHCGELCPICMCACCR